MNDGSVRSSLASIVGVAALGEDLRPRPTGLGDCSHFITRGRRADVQFITRPTVEHRPEQLIRLDAEESLAGAAEEFSASFSRCLAKADVAILSDYAKGTLAEVAQLIAACRAASVPVLVDPKGIDFQKQGLHEEAIEEFNQAIALKSTEKKKVRFYGMRYGEYMPHREKGYCHYMIKQYKLAISELETSYLKIKTKRTKNI